MIRYKLLANHDRYATGCGNGPSAIHHWSLPNFQHEDIKDTEEKLNRVLSSIIHLFVDNSFSIHFGGNKNKSDTDAKLSDTKVQNKPPMF